MVDITFVSLVISLRLEKQCHDPRALYALKSSFEVAFRYVSGCCDDECAACGGKSCAYHETFSRSLTADPAALKRYQKPSLPFVFTVPIVPPLPNKGAIVDMGLTLIGTAANHLSVYLSALRQMILQEKFRNICHVSILEVSCLDYHQERHSFDEKSKGTGVLLLSLEGLQQTSLVTPREVAIIFMTPLRLLQEGRPLRELSFPPLIRALFRRVSSLAYYYAGVEMDLDFKWLSQASADVATDATGMQWVKWDGGGSRADGLVGRCIFRGDLAEFIPFLLLGEYVHVGKGASFGFGSYRIDKITGNVENEVAMGKL